MTNFLKKHNKIMMLLVVVATLGLVRVALAANACPDKYIVLQVPIPGLGWCVKGFPEYLQAIYNLFVGISGILAVIMMMYGGFQWLIAGGNPTKISGAKATILSAMAGLSLLLASYAILNLINPNLTNLSLDKSMGDKLKAQGLQMAGGYCRRDSDLVDGGLGGECGKTFSLEMYKEMTCKGTYCNPTSESGWSSSGICVANYCTKLMKVASMKQYGYSGEVRSVAGAGSEPCGILYYMNKAADSTNTLNVGTFCANDGNCAISNQENYNITVNFDKIPIGSGLNIVGQFSDAGCY